MNIKKSKTKKKFHLEKSTIFCALCLFSGIVFISLYYVAIFTGHECDSAVATQSMITIIGGILSYCLYNFGLKNSRNKYGIDENGQPFKSDVGFEAANDTEAEAEG